MTAHIIVVSYPHINSVVTIMHVTIILSTLCGHLQTYKTSKRYQSLMDCCLCGPLLHVACFFLTCAVLISHVQTHYVCEAEIEVEAGALAEEVAVIVAEMEESVTDGITIPEPVTEATEEPVAEESVAEEVEEPVVEAQTSDHVSAEAEPAADEVVAEMVMEAVEEVMTAITEPEQVAEAVTPAAAAEEEAEVEVLAEEDAPEVTEVLH